MCKSDTVRLPPEFDDLGVGILLHDPDTGSILDTNERVEHLYGYPAVELQTMEVSEFIAPSADFSQEDAIERIRATAEGDSHAFERQIERSNGEIRQVRVRLSPTTLGETTYVLAEIRDISAYKARERRLRLLSRVIRHNLRNEMNILIGHANQLKNALEDASLADTADTVLASAVRALSPLPQRASHRRASREGIQRPLTPASRGDQQA